MKIEAIFIILLCLPCIVSAPAGELPPTIEVILYESEQFQSAVCRSPNVSSPAPYWSVNGTLLNNDVDLNLLYGATVSRDHDRQGHHLSTVTIPAVNRTLNDSIISCAVNTTVIRYYYLTIVEAQLVYLRTEQYHSALCVSPSVSSAAPYFKYNDDIVLNTVEINNLYEANVTRSNSREGHHQAVVVISALNNSTSLNDSTVTCKVNTTVIWKVHLIIESEDSIVNDTMVPTVEFDAATSDGVAQDVSVSSSTSKSRDSSSSAAWAAVLIVPVIAAVVGNVGIAIYIHRRGKCRREKINMPENMENLPDDDDEQPPSATSSQNPPTSSVVLEIHEDTAAVTSQPVIGTSQIAVVRRNERGTSFSRDTDTCGGGITNDVLDTSTSSCRPLNCYYEHINRENESEAPSTPPTVVTPSGREEQYPNDHEGRPLSVACFSGGKSGYDLLTMAKCWQKSADDKSGSSRRCQYILSTSDGNVDNGNDPSA